VINIWYPAKVNPKDKPMLYGDYIKIQTQDVTLKTFLKRIEDYNEKNSILYMFIPIASVKNKRKNLKNIYYSRSVFLRTPLH
jgi:hypothetical protein